MLEDQDPLRLPTQEELAERIRKARSTVEPETLDEVEFELPNSSTEVPAVPDIDEIHARLTSLETKSRSTKNRFEANLGVDSKQRAASQSDSRGLARGLAVGYTIIGCPMVGAGVGWLIDRQFHTTLAMGLLTLGGGVLGIWVAVSRLSIPD